MECPKCSKSVSEDVNTCPHCGFSIASILVTQDLGETGPKNDSSSGKSDEKNIPFTWTFLSGEENIRQTIKRIPDGSLGLPSIPVQRKTTVKQGEIGPGRIPDYELIEQIGEGGMGVIYAAKQNSIDRIVAVKMAKEVKNTRKKRVCLAEAMATGNLEHPNIVPIIDVGANAAGEIFYSMKNVSGDSWDTCLDEKTTQENIEILLRVCDAMAFAHSRGIIHRDLKPENIMLGEYGEVYVMDWGLAASVTPEGKAQPLNENSAIGGTLAYMAPEMGSGKISDISIRSDVYLLGAILFEIVTGEPPHWGETVNECLFNVIENNIASHKSKGGLIDIALKAMATDPEDRFESVRDFQKTLNEHLSHAESIRLTDEAEKTLATAEDDYNSYLNAIFGFKESLKVWNENGEAERGLQRAETLYAETAFRRGDLDLAESRLSDELGEHAVLLKKIRRAQKERAAGKRKLKVLLRGLVALTALIIITLTAAFFWIQNEQKKTLQEKNRTETERKRAEDEAKRSSAANAFITKMLAQADPKGEGGRTVTVLKALETISDGIEEQFQDDPATKQGLHESIATVFFGLGEYKKAESHGKKAVELAELVYGNEHIRYGTCRDFLGEVYIELAEYETAESYLKESLKLARKISPNRDMIYASKLQNLADLYTRQGKYEEAEPLFDEIMKIVDEEKGENIDEDRYLSIIDNLALFYFKRGNYEKSVPLVEKTLEIKKRKYGDDHPKYATALNNLASLYLRQEKYDEAAPLYREALAIIKDKLGDNHPEYGRGLSNLAALLHRQKEYSKAETIFLEALEVIRVNLGDDHPNYADTLNNLGSCLYDMGNYSEAEKYLLKALPILKSKLGEESIRYGSCLQWLARVYAAQEQYGKAEDLFETSIKIFSKKLGDDHEKTKTVKQHMEMMKEKSSS